MSLQRERKTVAEKCCSFPFSFFRETDCTRIKSRSKPAIGSHSGVVCLEFLCLCVREWKHEGIWISEIETTLAHL